MDDLLRQHERLAQLGHDVADLRPELGVADELFAHLLVVTVRGAAVDEREVAALVGGGEVADGHGGLGGRVGGGAGVVVPGRAGGLVGRVVVVVAELAHHPEDRGGVAGDVAALPAGLVVPQVRLLDPLRRPYFVDTVTASRSIFCTISSPWLSSSSSSARGSSSDRRSATGLGGRLLAPERLDGNGHSSMPSSSRRSSMSSCRIECRPGSTSAIMSRAPVSAR